MRLVPLDGWDPLPDGTRQRMGSSRGRWEGDTRVVETTNFTDKTVSFAPFTRLAIGTGPTPHLTEQFWLVDADMAGAAGAVVRGLSSRRGVK